jgi:hypothetical protein
MDTTDPDIKFDAEGVCNYCREAERELPKFRFTADQEKEALNRFATEIKNSAKGKYHAIVGLSGELTALTSLTWQN